jgi:hypothetical protein
MRKNLPPNFDSYRYGTADAPPWWMLAPAYSVLCLVRAPLGHDMVLLKDAFLRALSLVFVSTAIAWFWVALTARPLADSVGLRFMWYFAGLQLAVSLIVCVRRWWGESHGEHIHAAEAGYSWLSWYTPLPVALNERLIAPGSIAGLGYVLAHTSTSKALGWWLMASGASLMLLAGHENGSFRAGDRATVNNMAHAHADEDRVNRYESMHGSSQNNVRDQEPDFADLN